MSDVQEPIDATDNQHQDGAENASKDHKKFLDGFQKLMAILNGDETLFKNKIVAGTVPGLIEKLTKERREKFELDFVTKASALIDKKVEFDRFINQKRKEFEQAQANKEKEFLKEMNDLFGMINDMGAVMKGYHATLNSLTGSAQEVKRTPDQ